MLISRMHNESLKINRKTRVKGFGIKKQKNSGNINFILMTMNMIQLKKNEGH